MSTNNATNTYITPDTNNQILMPAQPAFFGYLGGNDANVTGDGTTFQIGSTTAMTEVYDQNADFNTNGTFTSPVTGRYHLSGCVKTYNVGTQTTQLTEIVTSNRTYIIADYDPSVLKNTSNYSQYGTAVFADMDASDTATIQVTVSGGAKTVGAIASSGNTCLQGALIC